MVFISPCGVFHIDPHIKKILVTAVIDAMVQRTLFLPFRDNTGISLSLTFNSTFCRMGRLTFPDWGIVTSVLPLRLTPVRNASVSMPR
jgi:hypothetical protein